MLYFERVTIIKIPRTPDQAVDALAEVSALITAKEWHRAAVVAALVGPAPGKPGPRSSSSNAATLTVTELTSKGIIGLSSQHSVERYRDAWCSERPAPALGDSVDLDGLPGWPPSTHPRLDDRDGQVGPRREAIERQATSEGAGTGSAIRVAESPKAMAAAIKADPQTAEVARRALAEVPPPPPDPAHAAIVDRDPNPFKGDLKAEAIRIRTRQDGITTDLQVLMRRAEPDQRQELMDILRPSVERTVKICDLAGLQVPDDASALEGGAK